MVEWVTNGNYLLSEWVILLKFKVKILFFL
jgi:hypothetical protein